MILSSLLFILNAIEDDEFRFIKPISVEQVDILSSADLEDSDNDGVYDAKDNCPYTKNGIKVNRLGCKLIKDDDNDGISNRDDRCPKTNLGIVVDERGCSPDSDEDGIIDSIDECPNTSKDFIVDKLGCPQTVVLKVNFESKKDTILKDSFSNIEKFAEFLKENIGYQAIIYGYTDSIDTDRNNKQLSQNRANAVMEALIDNGVKLTRVTAIGMGSKNPIADNKTPEGRAKNCRIEVDILQ